MDEQTGKLVSRLVCYGVDGVTGLEHRSQLPLGEEHPGQPAVHGHRIAIATAEGWLHLAEWNAQGELTPRKKVMLGAVVTPQPGARHTATPAWSPDGCTLAVGCEDCQVRVFDVDSQGEVSNERKFKTDGAVMVGLSFTSDGQHLLAGSDNGALYSLEVRPEALVEQGKQTTGGSLLTSAIAIMKDGTVLVHCADGVLYGFN